MDGNSNGGRPGNSRPQDDFAPQNDGVDLSGRPTESSPGLSRADYIRRMSEARERKAQQNQAATDRFLPDASDQVRRLFYEWSPPWYSPERRDDRLQVIDRHIAVLAGRQGYTLTDTEARAVGEHVNSIRDFQTVLSEFCIAGCMYLTVRPSSRITFRFPFFQPTYNFRWNPISGAAPVRFAWHVARYMAYALVWTFTFTNPATAAFAQSQIHALRQDERVKDLFARTVEQHNRPQQQHRQQQQQYGNAIPPQPVREYQSDQTPYQQDWEDNSAQNTASSRTESNSSWDRLTRGQSDYNQNQPKPVQQSRSWDAATDDFDDASPVASTAQSQASPYNGSGSGSAWDRIRHQSQPQPQTRRVQQPQSSQSWGNQESSSSSAGWGNSDEDNARSTVRDQAQMDFDKLLERERNTDGQERGSWSRK